MTECVYCGSSTESQSFCNVCLEYLTRTITCYTSIDTSTQDLEQHQQSRLLLEIYTDDSIE